MQSNKIIGRFVKKPELVYKNSTPYTNFTIAENNPYKDTLFLPLVAFDKNAETICKYQDKGDLVFIEYTTKNNNHQRNDKMEYGYSFVVNRFEFLSPKQDKHTSTEQVTEQDDEEYESPKLDSITEDDLPF